MSSRIVVAVFALLVAACAQTDVRNTWKAPDDSGPPLRKVMVVGVTSRADVRRTFEDAFVAQLKAGGVDAVPSYASEPDLGPESKDVLRTAVRANGVDGVLVARLVRRDQQTQVIPGTPVPAGVMRPGLYGYYPHAWVGHYEPATVVQTDVVTAEVKVFRTASEALIWTATTETFAPNDVAKSSRDYAQVVIKALTKDRLL